MDTEQKESSELSDDDKRIQALQEYFELLEKCGELDKKVTKLKRPFVQRMAELKEFLGKSVCVGGLSSLKADNVGGVSLVQKNSYKTVNRLEFDDWIAAPILGDEAPTEEDVREFKKRLSFLSSALTAEMCKEYRLEKGATIQKKSKRLVGGELPPGVEVTPSSYLQFRAADPETLDDEQ